MPQVRFGLIPAKGDGIAADQEGAAGYLQRAAKQGNEEAQFLYGGRLFFGESVGRDESRGFQFLKLLADPGHEKRGHFVQADGIVHLKELFGPSVGLTLSKLGQSLRKRNSEEQICFE
jgi:TPR repeat protein